MTMKLISTATIATSGTSYITFSNIPQTGDDLFLVISARSTSANRDHILRLNTEPGFAYTRISFFANGGNTNSVGSSGTTTLNSYTSIAIPGSAASSGSIANTFSASTVLIKDYRSTVAKGLLIESANETGNSEIGQSGMTSGLYSNTSAITRIDFGGYGLAVGSTASLYTITPGSGGATVS